MDQPPRSDMLSARAAAQLLGVSRATLYAYVSRGKLRSLPGLGRTHQYLLEDLERVRADSQARRGHGPAAGGALAWGAPVLRTELTELSSQGPRYRGTLATELVQRGVPFEVVAERLWTGEGADNPSARWPVPQRVLPLFWARSRQPTLTSLLLLLPELGHRDRARFLQSEAAETQRARRLLWLCVLRLAGRRGKRALDRARHSSSVAGALAVALGATASSKTEQALNSALVLAADHELNPSTFAARVAAATGADLYACLGAGVATLSGPKHGGATARIFGLLSEVASPRRARSVLLQHTRAGREVPGFGHPLYPDGDPRGRLLLELAEAMAPDAPRLRTSLAIVSTMRRLGHQAPTLDFGLVALSAALGLGPDAALAIFAIGRSAGWVAHVLEQRQSGMPLRPRALYQGV